MLNRELRSFASRTCVLRKTIAESDLTAAVNGTAQQILLGTPPLGFTLLGYCARVTGYFTGGGATTCALQLGSLAAAGDIMNTLNILSTTALNKYVQGTVGAQPNGPGYGGVDLYATITPDAGHSLVNLTAGSVDIELYFSAGPDLNFGY